MKTDDVAEPIRTLRERLVHENAWVRVYDDEVQFSDGSIGSFYHSRWKSPHGVAMVPVLDDTVLLLRHYRYGEKAWSLEIPQGFGTAGSSPSNDALRELREETGLSARRITPLLTLGLDYRTYVFVTEDHGSGLPNTGGLEASEQVAEFVRLPVADIGPDTFERIGVHDPVTLSALLTFRLRRL